MTTNTAFISRVLELTNQFRAQNGVAPLKLNEELNAAAQGHSQDMAQQDYFSHTGKNGSQPWDRAKAVGYEALSMGENIAAGQTTPEAVVEGWKNSAGHRANMLNASYKELGVGYYFLENDTGAVNYFRYWTQLFGSGDTNPATLIPTSTPSSPPTSPTSNSMVGTSGNDRMTGTDSNDTITGGAGDDVLFGGKGLDTLRGEAGNDRLVGGADNDVLTGGSGRDSFRFVSERAFTAVDFGMDKVTDFVRGLDKIVLDQTTFGAITATQIGTASNDAAAANSSKLIVYSRATGNLFYNQNGSAAGFGTGTRFAAIDNDNNASTAPPALAASDFQIIA